MRNKFVTAALAAAASTATFIGAAHATQVRVTFTNTQAAGGLSLTSLYFGFHDGTIDFFNAGERASPGIELIAERGFFNDPDDPDAVDLVSERAALDPNGMSRGGVARGLGGALPAGPIEPGETATFDVTLDPNDNRFAFFASMILPSNDAFVGVDNPTAIALFDDNGVFTPQTIELTGAFAYDAGTEVNDPNDGAAFIVGNTTAEGTPEDEVIRQGVSLGDFTSLAIAGGLVLDPTIANNFIIPRDFVFGQLTFSEVPLPPAALLMGAGLAGFAGLRRRKRA